MNAIRARAAMFARDRGLALIVAMLVAALAAAVAVSVATAQSQWLSQVEHRRDQVEAQSIATAGIAWARAIVQASPPGIDHLGEPWALPLPPTPVENGDVQGRIVDTQSMLNVNTLASAQHASLAQQRFAHLFAALGIPASTLASIADWVDADDMPSAGGAEDSWYLAQDDASLAANGAVSRFEELAVVRGMNAQAMMRVAPFVTALPGDTPVNVNTAPAEVLAAILTGIEPGALAALVAERKQHPFTSIADFRAKLPSSASLIDPDLVSVETHYFLVFVRARQGETIANAQALIRRDAAASSIVWQTVE